MIARVPIVPTRVPTRALAGLAHLAALAALAAWPATGRAQAPAEEPAAVTTAAAPAADDPVERLRKRLAERLGDRNAPGAVPEGAPLTDLRLTPRPAGGPVKAGREAAVPAGAVRKTAAAADTAAPAAATAAAVRSGGPASPAKPARGGPEAVPWAYEGAAGPESWASLRPEFALCGKGQRQSPIDIRAGLAVDLEPVRFDYRPSRFSVIDNGHTVQVKLAPGNSMEVGGRRYELQQFHFHRPSEERIDGRQFAMSAHLVHADPQGRLAVLAVVLDAGPAQPVVQTVWNNLPLEKHDEREARITVDPIALLPADRRYFTYMGSLTTPPCSEGVQWVVMRSPVSASAEQIELFGRLYPMNARPLQAATGRRILQSN